MLVNVLAVLVCVLIVAVVVLLSKLRKQPAVPVTVEAVAPVPSEVVEETVSASITPAAVPADSAVPPASHALFTTLSHELRTPLNGVLGVAQMLNEDGDDKDLRMLEGCARHMLSVLHTLVNLSKIQAEWGNLPEYREWVNLHDLTEQIKGNLVFRARTRGLKLEVKHQNDTLRLRGDSDHLQTIIETALLGSLECVPLIDLPLNELLPLRLTWRANKNEIKVVIDNPREQLSENRGERISEVSKLTTGENHTRIKMEFLYWAVSSALLENYEGAMLATTLNGGGVRTNLIFEMERMQASPSDELPVGGLKLSGSGESSKALAELPVKFSILVAEDDPVNRDLMGMLLKRMGQKAQFATNGQEVLDLMSVDSPGYDLILMDIDMPVMDGITAAMSLRYGEAGDIGKELPIVAVTAFNALSDQGKFKKAGMDYFLPKPVGVKQWREGLLDVMRRPKSDS